MYNNVTVKVTAIPSTAERLAYYSVRVYDSENTEIAFFSSFTIAFAMELLSQFLRHRYMEDV